MQLCSPPQPSLGIDVSKATLDACLLLGSRALQQQFDNSLPGLKKLLAWCDQHGAPAPLVVLEATGYYGDLATSTLHAAGLRVHVANARRIKDYARSLGRRNKTDRIDAQLIASFGAMRTLPAWEPPTPDQQLLRSLLRRLHEVETLRQAERNRFEAAAGVPALQKSLTRLVKLLTKEGALLEDQIAQLIKATPSLQADLARLREIEGIGPRCARWLCAELPRHLPNARAAAAWLGVTPRLHHSGTSVRSTTPVGHEGNRHLRRVLYMAALVASRHNPRLKAFADRLLAAGKSKMAVLLAVLHKLLKISFSILKHQTSYQPLHNPLQIP